MQINQLKPIHKKKGKRRIGRGGKRGTYSGRGLKGQKSRAGRRMEPAIRQFIKKYPKLKGYRSLRVLSRESSVNLKDIEKSFRAGETINPRILAEKKLVRRIKGRTPKIKILGSGEIKKKFVFENCSFSKKSREKIEESGSEIK
ncbi:MAG: 50S ribosomal protein L15 [Candidatus Nealsonbacteria bacterium RIFOXYB1_FULL_40_15]|uniref:Large ribosomal subunit protein uL15 n=2 Tax=Candidatus Nealsoniibacteriota TaxID=1817911 RepID=A0A1G2EM99_9BACT|nr:MAG: 50S ribosomal protein L15 [Candidatus Nealsonbacteria bacterium RIFOXYC1_FULL_40_7]OGZ27806.1 MAG: 50S ribosomal protein L15 [Candidatus Nealsonbacteria bacterium RIFOXYB1_FULL_40_15]OGZ28942.1 MAG: 50S ribosomal protein L15 [Candidatus Nealsonbacteria bacterium RIFOXYD1_FULL_39_11]